MIKILNSKILVVDEHPEKTNSLETILKANKNTVLVQDIGVALNLIEKKENGFDMWIVDHQRNYETSDLSSVQLINRGVRNYGSYDRPVVGIMYESGDGKLINIYDLEKVAVDQLIKKPVELSDLIVTSKGLLDKRSKIISTEFKDINKKYEEIERMKNEVLNIVSHELRTPLFQLFGFTEVLQDKVGNNDTDLDEYLTLLNESFKRLSHTVKRITEYVEVTNALYVPDYKVLLLGEIIKESTEKYKGEIFKKQLDLKTQIEDFEHFTRVDENLTKRIFEELLDNSIKYTSSGEIKISLETSKDSHYVKISDTGAGISDERLNEVFKLFSQDSFGYCRQFQGLGIGLSIVVEYCKRNGIEMKFDSVYGMGTNATLIFPKVNPLKKNTEGKLAYAKINENQALNFETETEAKYFISFEKKSEDFDILIEQNLDKVEKEKKNKMREGYLEELLQITDIIAKEIGGKVNNLNFRINGKDYPNKISIENIKNEESVIDKINYLFNCK